MKKRLNYIKIITLELIEIFKEGKWYDKILSAFGIPLLWMLICVVILFENLDYLEEEEKPKFKMKLKKIRNYDI